MILFRKTGNFYSVFDDDAIILHSLFKYKIKDGRVIHITPEQLNKLCCYEAENKTKGRFR